MIEKFYKWLHAATSRPEEAHKYSAGYWQDRVRKVALEMCRRESGRFLEIGCGEGLFLSQLADQNPDTEIWGVDNNPERVKDARKRFEGKNFTKIDISVQEASAISFADGYFDVVICINVLLNMESVETVRKVLAQAGRVCKRSGMIILEFRNSANPMLRIKYALARYYDDTVKDLPLRTYSMEEIESILESLSLKIIDKRYIGALSKRYAPCIVIEAEKI